MDGGNTPRELRRNPYIVSTWVKGTGFSGRTTLIKRILGGSRRCLWVLGTRRMGKTSLLRQLEYLTANDPSLGYWPLYWDLQGSRNAELLAKHLRLVLDGAAPRLAALQIHLPPDHDAITLLHHLWLQVARGSQRLLLLLDEAEELITLQQAAPEALAGLYTVVHDSEELITVLTATRELFELNELPTKTSPFLDPFLPPEHLAMLTLEETTQLIADPQLPAADIFLVTGGHPYLVQYLCSELWEGREFAEVVEATAANWVIADFFLKNHVQLTYNEQRIVQHLAEVGSATAPDLAQVLSLPILQLYQLYNGLQGLKDLGYVCQQGSSYALAGTLFAQWLLRHQDKIRPAADRPVPREGIHVNQAMKQVWVDGQLVPGIGPNAFKLLSCLAQRPNQPVSICELLQHIYNDHATKHWEGDVYQLVAMVRESLKAAGAKREYLQTVRGFGYKLRSG